MSIETRKSKKFIRSTAQLILFDLNGYSFRCFFHFCVGVCRYLDPIGSLFGSLFNGHNALFIYSDTLLCSLWVFRYLIGYYPVCLSFVYFNTQFQSFLFLPDILILYNTGLLKPLCNFDLLWRLCRRRRRLNRRSCRRCRTWFCGRCRLKYTL